MFVPPGGGGVLPYMPPQRVLFLRRFGPKTGIDFARAGRESGMVFGGTSGEQERKRNVRIQNGFYEIFAVGVDLSNDDIIS